TLARPGSSKSLRNEAKIPASPRRTTKCLGIPVTVGLKACRSAGAQLRAFPDLGGPAPWLAAVAPLLPSIGEKPRGRERGRGAGSNILAESLKNAEEGLAYHSTLLGECRGSAPSVAQGTRHGLLFPAKLCQDHCVLSVGEHEGVMSLP